MPLQFVLLKHCTQCPEPVSQYGFGVAHIESELQLAGAAPSEPLPVLAPVLVPDDVASPPPPDASLEGAPPSEDISPDEDCDPLVDEPLEPLDRPPLDELSPEVAPVAFPDEPPLFPPSVGPVPLESPLQPHTIENPKTNSAARTPRVSLGDIGRPPSASKPIAWDSYTRALANGYPSQVVCKRDT